MTTKRDRHPIGPLVPDLNVTTAAPNFQLVRFMTAVHPLEVVPVTPDLVAAEDGFIGSDFP